MNLKYLARNTHCHLEEFRRRFHDYIAHPPENGVVLTYALALC